MEKGKERKEKEARYVCEVEKSKNLFVFGVEGQHTRFCPITNEYRRRRRSIYLRTWRAAMAKV